MILFMANVGHPDPAEYASFYANYVGNVTEDDVVAALEAQARATAELLARVDEEKASYRYAPEKWSVKQIVGHVTDGERVFAYRALAIAHGERFRAHIAKIRAAAPPPMTRWNDVIDEAERFVGEMNRTRGPRPPVIPEEERRKGSRQPGTGRTGREEWT